MRVVSAFEYAIMQAVHESDPSKVTKQDLESCRPETQDEELKRRKDKIEGFFNKIKTKRVTE